MLLTPISRPSPNTVSHPCGTHRHGHSSPPAPFTHPHKSYFYKHTTSHTLTSSHALALACSKKHFHIQILSHCLKGILSFSVPHCHSHMCTHCLSHSLSLWLSSLFLFLCLSVASFFPPSSLLQSSVLLLFLIFPFSLLSPKLDL